MGSKALVTVLGMIGEGKAVYLFNGAEHESTNILPLLVRSFGNDYEICPVGTPESVAVQKKVLAEEHLSENVLDNTVHVSDTDGYDAIFRKINECISSFDEVIVDVSHGFRHLPILMTINLIVQNVVDPGKISAILFAKEVAPRKQYEVIDLVGYLDIAMIAFTLSRFSDNYTVSNNMRFRTPSYQSLVDNLNRFSHNLLGNSLKYLIQPDGKQPPLVEKIIIELDTLKHKDERIANLSGYLDRIKSHLQEIQSYRALKEYEMLFRFSSLMHEKWYLLNAVTLLNEAIGLYCMNCFMQYDPGIEQDFKKFLEIDKQGLYYAASESSTFVRLADGFNTDTTKMIKSKTASKILKELKVLQFSRGTEYRNFVQLVDDVSKMRNNLAHANSGKAVKTVHHEIASFLKRFETMCIKGDVLQKCEGVPAVQEKHAKPVTEKTLVVTKSGIRKKV